MNKVNAELDEHGRLRRCNICGVRAEFVVTMHTLALNLGGIMRDTTAPFFLCKNHKYIWNRLHNGPTKIKTLFDETAEVLA